jgi:outer membrane protein assembly factor BamD
MVKQTSILLFVVFLMILSGCGSGEKVTRLTAEERFNHAKALFDSEDYLEAINEFTVITLQDQGSKYASEAQFYIAECRFRRGEYLLAAFEYGVLKRSYPASPRVAEAQYRLGLSYYNLSPRSSLDQQYTKKAIDELQTFVEYYPSNPMAADADAKIKELTTKLAKKLYDAARQYLKLERYRAALLYFEDVIEEYHDTEFGPLAYLDRVEVLIDRKRYPEAQAELTRFVTRYPNSVLRSRADALQERLSREAPALGGGKGTATLSPLGQLPEPNEGVR